jgi:hypothetical protein
VSREEGGASLALLGVAGLTAVLAIGLAAVGTLLAARAQAGAAADAAALAAAPVTFMPFGAAGTPMEEAARFAGLNGAHLLRCVCPLDRSWEPRTVQVDVELRVDLWPIGSVSVVGSGRAEFVPALLLGG